MPLYTAPGTGGLSFTTNPPGVTIVLEDMEYQVKTPAAINNIPPGSHPFILKMEGYQDYSDMAEVVEHRLCCIETDMAPVIAEAPPVSKIECSTTPLEIKPVQEPIPPAPPSLPVLDIKTLIIGAFVGLGIAFLIEKFFGKKD